MVHSYNASSHENTLLTELVPLSPSTTYKYVAILNMCVSIAKLNGTKLSLHKIFTVWNHRKGLSELAFKLYNTHDLGAVPTRLDGVFPLGPGSCPLGAHDMFDHCAAVTPHADATRARQAGPRVTRLEALVCAALGAAPVANTLTALAVRPGLQTGSGRKWFI